MKFPRKYLPSMSVLCAFEAPPPPELRRGAGLSLTQSAVSRQIRALEELLARTCSCESVRPCG